MSLTLVTGPTGFIGSHVTRQLLDRGERVRLLVRTPAKLAEVGIDPYTRGLEVVTGDLLDPETIPPALDGVSHVHHIAGSISLQPRDREKMYDLNVTTTRNLFEALERTDVERVVYLASIFALAGGNGVPATEKSPWNLGSLAVDYVQAKRQAELFAWECHERGMPLVFAYPCFCYGPGDVYVSSSELVAGFLAGKIPAYVNGGHNAMDVRDAAAGLILAMERGQVGERYLLGGENITTEQLFGLLSYTTGRPVPRVKMPATAARLMGKLGDRLAKEPPLTEQMALMAARRWYYDDTKAREELGYQPRPLEETLRDAVAWFTVRGLG